MFRRSSSASHIPLPKNEIRRSKSTLRTSGLKRSIGTTPVLKSTGSNVGKYTTPSLSSKTGGVRKNSLVTPSVAIGLFKRSTGSLTPSHRPSKSPYKIGSESDKDWIHEQFVKVGSYLQSHRNCPEHILTVFKPPITIDTFVCIIKILFKEINPAGIAIQTTNYKNIVVTTLKMLHYPGNVKNSFLQTVNTKHAWRDVICMFSWLVDLINTINSVPVQATVDDDIKRKKIECVTDFITKRYLAYNGTGDQEEVDREFEKAFGKILNVDENELTELETRVANLRKDKETQIRRLEDQQIKNESVKSEMDSMQNEIDSYYENKTAKEDDAKYVIEGLKNQRERLKAAINKKKERVAELRVIVDKQQYTVEDKKRIVRRIDELQHTIGLKKEANKEKKALKDVSDCKLTETKKELQTQVYHFNNRIMKLASIHPELKALYLQEKDFLSKEFQDDMEELLKNYNIFKNTFASEIAAISSSISNMKTEVTRINQQKKAIQDTTAKLDESIKTVEKKIEMIDKEVEMMNKQRKESRDAVQQKIAEMKQSNAILEKNKQELNDLKEMRTKKANDLEIKKRQALEFFRSLHKITAGNLEEMNKIRSEIFEMLANCLTKVETTERQILDDLHQLDEVRDN